MIQGIIDQATEDVRQIVERAHVDSMTMIARYAAAFAVNFTDWMGRTILWVRHEKSRYVLADNLRCESVEDHVGMLLQFAELSGALPARVHFATVRREVSEIRHLFRDPLTAGLSGMVLLTVLEVTSEVFIPDLAERARRCGCTNFTYTDVHGSADIAHSLAFTEAVKGEATMGYIDAEAIMRKAADAAVTLMRRIYA